MSPIASLVPHAGAMVLLERVERWDARSVLCRTRTHLDGANPLRRDGRLTAVCGAEYGLQAAALHGALCAGGVAQPPGYAASLRAMTLRCDRLDDPAVGELAVAATLQAQESGGIIYEFELRAEDGAMLVSGRATVALPR